MIAALLLAGCLPRQALSRADELEATRYHARVRLRAREGELAEAEWSSEGDLIWQWTRTFRDGTFGHVVVFEGMRTEDGGAAWERAAVEVRSFRDGEIVAVDGLGPWAGTAGHLELADVLWPALSPRVPDAADTAYRAAWPILYPRGPGVRYQTHGSWASAGGVDTWQGTLTGEGPVLQVRGTALARIERDRGGVRGAMVQRVASLTTRWAGGREVHQQMEAEVTLERVGSVPALPLLDTYTRDDAASDALPVRLADGRVVDRAPVRPDQLPFLLLPEASVAETRGTLLGSGSPP